MPYTTVFPKPLAPLGDQPILEVIVKQLGASGFGRLVFAVNHLAELVRAFFGDGERWAVQIRYSLEHEPLGTAGPLGLIDGLDENFLVMNGDILSDIDYEDLWRAHVESGALATIATCSRKVPVSLGVLEIGDDSRLTAYIEKPTLQYRVSTGIYAFSRKIKDHVPRGQYLDLPSLMQALVRNGEHVHCYGFHGTWLDIGNPDDFVQATERFEAEKTRFLREDLTC